MTSPSPWLGLDASAISVRLSAIATEAAGIPLVVRFGEESDGYRNVGVELPRARAAATGRLLRLRVARALEAASIRPAPMPSLTSRLPKTCSKI